MKFVDLVVLEIGERIGVSVAGSVLAQLGATVIFVEHDPGSAFKAGKSSCRAPYAAGKRSLRVRKGSSEDHRLLTELALTADVVLASSDVDGVDLKGLMAEATAAIHCDVTTFGSDGPLAGEALSDAQVQALCGIAACTGTPDSGPLPIPIPLVETMAGLYAAGGVLSALRWRETTGQTQPVEVALYDVGFHAMTSFLAPAFEGQATGNARVGNRHTMASPWNVYRASDGWILLCAGSDEQWRRICDLMARPDLALAPGFARNADRVAQVAEVDAVVQAWVADRTVDACVESLCALGLPCGPVAPMLDHPREANLIHRGMIQAVFDPVDRCDRWIPGSAFRTSRASGQTTPNIPVPDADRTEINRISRRRTARPIATRTSPGDAGRPLAGLRIIEIGHYTTAPLAARTLAGLGAEVIKIEPPGGEAVRSWPPARLGQGVFYTFQNSDKRSICLDLDTPEGQSALAGLLREADILVENLRPGALARKGFSAQDVARLNSRLVYCSISGFGAESLYPGRAAFDAVIQAMSGLMGVVHVDGMPLKTGPSLADHLGAAFGFFALIAAVMRRDDSGEGEFIDLAMQDIAAWATQAVWNETPYRSPPLIHSRDGGHVMGLGDQALPVLAVKDVLHAPQTLARQLWSTGEIEGTPFPLLAIPLRLPGAPRRAMQPGPPLGRDNSALLSLGMRQTDTRTQETHR